MRRNAGTGRSVEGLVNVVYKRYFVQSAHRQLCANRGSRQKQEPGTFGALRAPSGT